MAIKTMADLEAATPEERRAYYRALLAEWEENYQHQYQAATHADQRAFERGYRDLYPGPGQHYVGAQSSTNRIANL
jgi:hypothetical protein